MLPPSLRALGILFCASVCTGLKMQLVVIPRHVKLGDDVTMACLYDLEGVQLYSIKWYKDGREFYRYEPSTARTKKNFPQPGLKVRLSASNASHVYLEDTTLRYSGRYTCEVSIEAPSFASQQGKGDMRVVVFPEDGPTITGGKSRYVIGDSVRVNCTSHRSKPAAELMWYINGEEAALEHLQLHAPTIHTDGLETVTLGLHFHVRPHHLRAGNIKLKCVSQIADLVQPLYWQSREQSATADRPPEVSHVVDGSSSSAAAPAPNDRTSSSCVLCHEIANLVIVVVSLILAR